MSWKIEGILFLGFIFGTVISMQFWAFFTAPWLREQGHRSANWKVWFFGFPEIFDLGKAVWVARKEKSHIPWPLWCHLFFQFIQISCFTILVIATIISSLLGVPATAPYR